MGLGWGFLLLVLGLLAFVCSTKPARAWWSLVYYCRLMIRQGQTHPPEDFPLIVNEKGKEWAGYLRRLYGFSVEISGKVPDDRPTLYLVNHQSAFDIRQPVQLEAAEIDAFQPPFGRKVCRSLETEAFRFNRDPIQQITAILVRGHDDVCPARNAGFLAPQPGGQFQQGIRQIGVQGHRTQVQPL